MATETTKEYLKRLLPLLKKPIPHSWRVQSYSKYKPLATVMAYIDARDAQEVLDAYCDYGWHRKHQMLNDRLYCSIGIEMPDGSIQWREDCGTESNEDKEKGQASDSFKRAGVNWGIGRFLYDMDIQYVTANAIKEDQYTKKEEGKIYAKSPYAINEQGKRINDMTAYINSRNPNAPQAPVSVEEPSVAEKASQMGKQVTVLTEKELNEYKGKIDAITQPTGLTGFYNSLTADVQANPSIIQWLKDKRESFKVKA